MPKAINEVLNMGKSIVEVVAGVKGCDFAGMDTVTNVTLKGGKKNPMQGRVQKHMNGASVMLFSNTNGSAYAAKVQRHLEAEGKDPASFTLSPRAWGTRMEGLPIVEHKGEKYLEVIFLKSGKVHYTLDGQPIDKAEIEGLDDDKPEGAQGGVDNKVIIRTFKVESIKAIRMNHEEYTDLV